MDCARSQIAAALGGGSLKADKGRKHLEEEYLELEEKVWSSLVWDLLGGVEVISNFWPSCRTFSFITSVLSCYAGYYNVRCSGEY